MPGLIYESRLLSATDTDVLSVGRLNSIPYAGLLTMRFQSNLGTAAANWLLTLQLPGGDVPVDNMQVPAGGGAAVIGVMDTRQLLEFTFPAINGGHFVVSLTETGTAVCFVQFILRPR